MWIKELVVVSVLCRREILFLIDRSRCVSCNANKYKIKFFMREANYQRRRLVRGQVGNKNILNLCLFFYNQTHRFFELNKKKKQEIIANSFIHSSFGVEEARYM